ncbi:type VI secretion system baseplate subunit TssG, partial [Escherichia coli]|nr:type VI secretion system baseplate subunit TssG [Escherichia coli]EET8199120.1 type VI secretion system baseplate subunit TssG [Escherichia coli]EFA1811209.1 type VI secretion system baseplate subunit TssG [Escherichia coli]EIW7095767.1 type VI secretion system baseplate subunit TssG [Escherichia coli]EJQ6102163.1 type VI secretion system baseplate subunit TssG [Escherichia coli]
REGHEALTSFLDIFSHRITTQYYRIWRKYAYPATFEEGGRDATSQCLLGLVGLGIPGTAEQVATPVSRFLALLGAMRLPTRNAEGIRALVSLLAPDTRALITEPDPVKVHIDNRSGLGAGKRIRLSQRAPLGKTTGEACSRLLMTLETADPDEAEGWLPGGVLHTDLLVLLRVYLGYRSDVRLRLTVPVRLLPEPRLGKGRPVQLGRTGLLGLKAGKLSNGRESLTVSLGCYEGLKCAALPSAEDGHYRFE